MLLSGILLKYASRAFSLLSPISLKCLPAALFEALVWGAGLDCAPEPFAWLTSRSLSAEYFLKQQIPFYHQAKGESFRGFQEE